jgi:hypothetical protein
MKARMYTAATHRGRSPLAGFVVLNASTRPLAAAPAGAAAGAADGEGAVALAVGRPLVAVLRLLCAGSPPPLVGRGR